MVHEERLKDFLRARVQRDSANRRWQAKNQSWIYRAAGKMRTDLHFQKKINLSTALASQAVGIKEVDEGIWLVSFREYDLGYIDLQEKTLQASKVA
jgi:hypothetical protein